RPAHVARSSAPVHDGWVASGVDTGDPPQYIRAPSLSGTALDPPSAAKQSGENLAQNPGARCEPVRLLVGALGSLRAPPHGSRTGYLRAGALARPPHGRGRPRRRALAPDPAG